MFGGWFDPFRICRLQTVEELTIARIAAGPVERV